MRSRCSSTAVPCGLGYQVCDDYLARMVKHMGEMDLESAGPATCLLPIWNPSPAGIIWPPWPAHADVAAGLFLSVFSKVPVSSASASCRLAMHNWPAGHGGHIIPAGLGFQIGTGKLPVRQIQVHLPHVV